MGVPRGWLKWETPKGTLARCRCACKETVLVVLRDARKKCWACGQKFEQIETVSVGSSEPGKAVRADLTVSDKKMFGEAAKAFEWGDR